MFTDQVIIKILFDSDSEIGDDVTIFGYISNDGMLYNIKNGYQKVDHIMEKLYQD